MPGDAVDRVFRFSTFGPNSAKNALAALEPNLDLTPVAAQLRAQGSASDVGDFGHLWGIKPGSKLWGANPRLEAGDYGARITRPPGSPEVVSHIYEVLAVIDDVNVPSALGIAWEGGTQTWPISIILGPAIPVPRPVPYAQLQASDGWQAPGGNWEGLFVPTDIRQTLSALNALAPPTLSTPPASPLVVNANRSEGQRRVQRSRLGQGLFRSQVLAAYGNHCAACDVTGTRLLEAAHLVDEGWSDARWDVGLPLCRNHHRLLDLGILQLGAGGNWTVLDSNYSSTVTKTDITHLASAPHPHAVSWKLSHPVAGQFRG